MRKAWSILILLLLVAQIGWGQTALTNFSPSQVVGRPYTGSVTITGSNTLFGTATAGINLRLTHASSGIFYDFGNAPFGATWATPSTHTSITGTITLPGNAPVGMYNARLEGYEGSFSQLLYIYTGNSIFEVLPDDAYFEGSVIADSDSNCVNGVGDIGIPNQTVVATPGPFYGLTDANGNFTMNIPSGTYTFSVAHPPGGTIICPTSPFTQNATVTISGDTARGIDFYSKSLHTTDISTQVVVLAHRPGFNNGQALVNVHNPTPTIANNVVLKIVKPSLLSYMSFSPSNPTSIVGDTATYQIGALAPYSTFSVTVLDSTPLGALGNQITYSANATTSSIESSTLNNSDAASVIVTGSYDPNDKQVWTTNGANADGFIDTSDATLRYLIRFQNTGNDTAFNIAIRDTFDTNLDMQSLTILGSSHPSYVQTSINGNNLITFKFDNILLPDSTTNEELSHGWVEYTINRLIGLPIGTEIDNTAHIYFDFNAPIVTNTVTSKICPPLDSNFSFSTTALTTTFQANSVGGANSWLWDFGDGQTGTGMNPSHTYAASGTYNVCVTIGNACGRSESSCFPVVINCPPPIASFGQSVANFTATFTDQSTNSPIAWNWDFGNFQTSTAANPSHTYSANGIYNVCLTTTNACGTSSQVCQQVTINCVSPNTAFSRTMNQLVVTFSDLSTNNPNTWNWTFGDGNSSFVQSPTHTYSSYGTYQVCLTTSNACGQQTLCDSITLVPVGIHSPSWIDAYLAPNPANQLVTLHILAPNLEKLSLNLQDALGRKIQHWEHRQVNGDFRQNIDTRELAEGIYFLRLSSENWNQTMRLVVRHD